MGGDSNNRLVQFASLLWKHLLIILNAFQGYSKSFCDDYLIPMTAAVWSTSPDKASLDFPAQTLIRFLWNHHLLSTIAARPDWLTIPGGSQRYIDAITTVLGTQLHVHLESAVLGVARPPAPSKEKVRLFTALPADVEPEEWEFDHVVFACHGKLPLKTTVAFSFYI